MPAGSLVQIASTLPPAGEMGATTKTQETGLLRVSEQTDRQTDTQLTSLTRLLRKNNFMIHGGNKMMHSYDIVVKDTSEPSPPLPYSASMRSSGSVRGARAKPRART